MIYDIVLRNARVIDPSQALDGPCDIAIAGGKIAAIGKSLDVEAADEEDLRGLYAAPGLVDLHGHWYEGSAFGIDPHVCLRQGVTTAVDAGTTGFVNFEEFRRHQISQAQIRILAFLNIAAAGIPTPLSGELMDIRNARVEETAELLLAHPQELIGVKVRLGTMSGDNAIEALTRAVRASDAVRAPVMVHISKTAPTKKILNSLRPGDILTHCFQGRGDGLVADGCIIQEALEARERGVLFDVGHGCSSFSWDASKRAFEQFFFPDTISTDLHRFSIERWCIDLPTTMSKFLHLGMSLYDVILKTTWAPACAIKQENEIGTLRPGAAADVFVFSIETGEFPLEDTHLRVQIASQRLRPHKVLKAGRWVPGTHASTPLRKFHACDYEVFRTVEESA